MQKILSIGIPTYNMERYLARSLNSVLLPEVISQIEVIVVNDGSTDSSLQIAREYESRYPGTVRVIDKENGGAGSAVNTAIYAATGKYFKELDADDWFNRKAFIKYIDAIQKFDVDLIVTHYADVYEDGKVEPIYYAGSYFGKVYDFTDYVIQEHTGHTNFRMHGITYRTSLLQENNFRMSHCYYSDMEYLVFPQQHVKTVVLLNLVLYRYLLGREGQSVSESGMVRNFDDHIYIARQLVDFHYNLEDKESALAKNAWNTAWSNSWYNIYMIFERIAKADKGKAKKYLNDYLEFLRLRDENMYAMGLEYASALRKKNRLIKIMRFFRKKS